MATRKIDKVTDSRHPSLRLSMGRERSLKHSKTCSIAICSMPKRRVSALTGNPARLIRAACLGAPTSSRGNTAGSARKVIAAGVHRYIKDGSSSIATRAVVELFADVARDLPGASLFRGGGPALIKAGPIGQSWSSLDLLHVSLNSLGARPSNSVVPFCCAHPDSSSRFAIAPVPCSSMAN